MNIHRPISAHARTALFCAPALVASVLLAACGGGGSDTPAGVPTVSSATATGETGAAVMYSQKLLITVNGSNLNGGLSVTSPGCKAGPVLSTAAPYISTAAVAYYLCTVSAQGASEVNVARESDGASLFTAAYTVPVPMVRLTAKRNGALIGEMTITLAPVPRQQTVNNFLAYVNSGFYDGTVFHRVVAGFVIQGGGYGPITPGVPPVAKAPLNPPIPLEVGGGGPVNNQWTIAMARTNDPNSATSQFFINVVDNRAILDPQGTNAGYSAFGTITAGTSVASAIVGAPCSPLAGFSECVPNENVVITATQFQ